MFSYEEIEKYSETDIRIYKYVVSNIEKIQHMTIRELAKELQVSASTVLRFCNMNNFEGYSEFKEALKQEAALQAARPPMEDLQELSDFFIRANSSAFEEKVLFAVEVLRKAGLIIFMGMGSSGTLAKYGARYFSNMGHFAVGLEDAFYPIEFFHWKNTAVIAFSESGETQRLIEAVNQFKKKKCCVLSITNSPESTLAKLSDWNFSYNLNTKRINGGYNGTTQIPVIFMIETLAKRI